MCTPFPGLRLDNGHQTTSPGAVFGRSLPKSEPNYCDGIPVPKHMYMCAHMLMIMIPIINYPNMTLTKNPAIENHIEQQIFTEQGWENMLQHLEFVIR